MYKYANPSVGMTVKCVPAARHQRMVQELRNRPSTWQDNAIAGQMPLFIYESAPYCRYLHETVRNNDCPKSCNIQIWTPEEKCSLLPEQSFHKALNTKQFHANFE